MCYLYIPFTHILLTTFATMSINAIGLYLSSLILSLMFPFLPSKGFRVSVWQEYFPEPGRVWSVRTLAMCSHRLKFLKTSQISILISEETVSSHSVFCWFFHRFFTLCLLLWMLKWPRALGGSAYGEVVLRIILVSAVKFVCYAATSMCH